MLTSPVSTGPDAETVELPPPIIPPQQEYASSKNDHFEKYGECYEYATELTQRRRIPTPSQLYIAYRLRKEWNLNEFAPWGFINDRAANRRVADNGFHVGVVVDGAVFDNWYLGVPLSTWPLLYETVRATRPYTYATATLAQAHAERYGQLKLFKGNCPRNRYDPIWEQGETLP